MQINAPAYLVQTLCLCSTNRVARHTVSVRMYVCDDSLEFRIQSLQTERVADYDLHFRICGNGQIEWVQSDQNIRPNPKLKIFRGFSNLCF